MKFKVIIVFFLLSFTQNSNSENTLPNLNDYFYIGKMDSYNKEFTLYFKSREKAILARGENNNYINDYPQDLYIYDHKSKKDFPLISHDWFPAKAKKILKNYNFPVFPDDFAYYLLSDNNTLVLVGATKNVYENLQFNIKKRELKSIQKKGKLSFIISTYAKNCGYMSLKSKFSCNMYKPLVSNNLIN